MVAAAVAVLTAGCASDGLLFHQDRRVSIQAPARNEKVALPVTVKWTLDAGSAGDIAAFGVLFDIDPPPAGKTLSYFGRNDPVCKRTAGCPDAAYLATRGIYRTTDPSFTISRLSPVGGTGRRNHDKEPHEVTIIALDGSGRRVNEASWTRRFVVVPK